MLPGTTHKIHNFIVKNLSTLKKKRFNYKYRDYFIKEFTMGRAARYIEPNTDYHVYNLCRQGEPLLKGEWAKSLFMEAIKDCQEVYHFELGAIQIMDNHIHLIISTLDNAAHSISVIMKWIKSTFTRRYNRIMRQSGPFWNCRFGAKVISLAENAQDYLNTLLWYLEYNPIRKGSKKKPGEHRFGSLRHYLKCGEKVEQQGIRPQITLHRHFMNLADNIKERLERFLKFEEGFKKRFNDYTGSKQAKKRSFLFRLHRSFVSSEREKEAEKVIKDKSDKKNPLK